MKNDWDIQEAVLGRAATEASLGGDVAAECPVTAPSPEFRHRWQRMQSHEAGQ